MSGPHRSPARRIAIGAALFLLVLLCAYVGVRTHRLSGVPDIGDPFDLQEYGTVSIDEDDNAFRHYAEAAKLYVDFQSDIAFENSNEVEKQGWSVAGDELKKWLDDNQPALDIWRRGTEKTDSLYLQPRDHTMETDLTVTQNSRDFSRISLLNAQRIRHEGNPQLAWEVYRTTLRCSRHSGMHGCLIERLVGAAIFGMTAEQMLNWSADDKLTAEDLQRALHELDEIYETTAPLSVALRCEYFSSVSAWPFHSPEQNEGVLPRKLDPTGLLMEVTSEGELFRRIVRLVFAYWMSQCDLPRYQRTNFSADEEIPFERDALNPSPQIPLTRAELYSLFYKSPPAALLTMSLADGDDAVTREQTHYAALQTALALQIYHREHGEFPASLDELIGGDLKTLPIDPYSQGQPLGYRRDEHSQGVTLWSVAADGTDEFGKVDWEDNTQPGDWVFQIDRPGMDASPATPVE